MHRSKKVSGLADDIAPRKSKLAEITVNGKKELIAPLKHGGESSGADMRGIGAPSGMQRLEQMRVAES